MVMTVFVLHNGAATCNQGEKHHTDISVALSWNPYSNCRKCLKHFVISSVHFSILNPSDLAG
jgi:hypothetical protein